MFPLLVLVLQVLCHVSWAQLDLASKLISQSSNLVSFLLRTYLLLCVCAMLTEGSRERQIPWSGVSDDYEPLYVGVWIPSRALCKPNLCSSC